MIIIMVIVS